MLFSLPAMMASTSMCKRISGLALGACGPVEVRRRCGESSKRKSAMAASDLHHMIIPTPHRGQILRPQPTPSAPSSSAPSQLSAPAPLFWVGLLSGLRMIIFDDFNPPDTRQDHYQ